jgi:hypothetical protein
MQDRDRRAAGSHHDTALARREASSPTLPPCFCTLSSPDDSPNKRQALKIYTLKTQITRKTFPLVCEEIEDLIGSCEFYSIDVEMTSLDAAHRNFQISWQDSPEERCIVFLLSIVLCLSSLA